MNKKTGALILALGLISFSAMTTAEPRQGPWTPISQMCFLHNGTIYPTVAAAGEYKVVYGPYSGKCANSYHKFTVKAVGGLWLPLIVERLDGGTWREIRSNLYSPSEQFGAGTFRIIFNNKANPLPVRYQGTYSVPL
ncbi:hypothetical protein [Pseudomonas sp. NA-150]|uniref:hypothetical protein n=1 Tax=Pseudomonas sp. NA-150 TaxID=3367525 RepID=UPI0037C9CA99